MYRKGITKQQASIGSTTKLGLIANFTGKNQLMKNSKSSIFFIKIIIKSQFGIVLKVLAQKQDGCDL